MHQRISVLLTSACDGAWFHRQVTTFLWNMLPPFSGKNSKKAVPFTHPYRFFPVWVTVLWRWMQKIPSKSLYLSTKLCGFLFYQNHELTVNSRSCDVQWGLHRLGPFCFLIRVKPRSELNSIFSKTLGTMKWATQSKENRVLFSFQTQLQRFARPSHSDFS